ncbi:TPA: fatty acid cis/trans isomerase, partial [Vibrio cholerae]|nr:fatty acid cis/trans isomerase [Vibrio cholerae]
SSLFDEQNNRDPKNDNLTLVRGVVGSYPSAYLTLKENQIPELYQRLAAMKSEQDYVALLDRFAVRRSSPEFWAFSDLVHQWYRQDQPIEFGLLDYNRFENR